MNSLQAAHELLWDVGHQLFDVVTELVERHVTPPWERPLLVRSKIVDGLRCVAQAYRRALSGAGVSCQDQPDRLASVFAATDVGPQTLDGVDERDHMQRVRNVATEGEGGEIGLIPGATGGLAIVVPEGGRSQAITRLQRALGAVQPETLLPT